MNLVYVVLGTIIMAPSTLRAKRERGDITLQQVIWAAVIAALAAAVTAAIVGIVNGWLARIPT